MSAARESSAADDRSNATRTVAAQPRARALRSKRGERTRARLIDAAREVFERDGFLNAKINDIATTAKVAVGSFYTYFDSKEEIFHALIEEVEADLASPPEMLGPLADGSIRSTVEASTRHYLAAYDHTARLEAAAEEVAAINREFRRVRVRRDLELVERNARAIRRLQDHGLVDDTLDAALASEALWCMVKGFASNSLARDRRDPDTLVHTLSRLVLNALSIDAVNAGQTIDSLTQARTVSDADPRREEGE